MPSFSFLGHDSFLIYGRRTTERTNRRTENEAPSLPSFLHSAAAELPRCSLGCLGNDLTCLPLSLSPLRCPKAFKTRCVRSTINSRNLFHYFVHPCLSFYLSRAAAVAALSPSLSLSEFASEARAIFFLSLNPILPPSPSHSLPPLPLLLEGRKANILQVEISRALRFTISLLSHFAGAVTHPAQVGGNFCSSLSSPQSINGVEKASHPPVRPSDHPTRSLARPQIRFHSRVTGKQMRANEQRNERTDSGGCVSYAKRLIYALIKRRRRGDLSVARRPCKQARWSFCQFSRIGLKSCLNILPKSYFR